MIENRGSRLKSLAVATSLSTSPDMVSWRQTTVTRTKTIIVQSEAYCTRSKGSTMMPDAGSAHVLEAPGASLRWSRRWQRDCALRGAQFEPLSNNVKLERLSIDEQLPYIMALAALWVLDILSTAYAALWGC